MLSVRIAKICGVLCLLLSLQQLCFHDMFGELMQSAAVHVDAAVFAFIS